VEHSGSQYASDDFGPAHDAAVVAAKAARLRYVNDHWPGIVRERNGTRFVYRDSSDAAIADRAELARINAIAVPPAWTEVWICPDPDGHIQATGRDSIAITPDGEACETTPSPSWYFGEVTQERLDLALSSTSSPARNARHRNCPISVRTANLAPAAARLPAALPSDAC
jgi:hypothetical protein